MKRLVVQFLVACMFLPVQVALAVPLPPADFHMRVTAFGFLTSDSEEQSAPGTIDLIAAAAEGGNSVSGVIQALTSDSPLALLEGEITNTFSGGSPISPWMKLSGVASIQFQVRASTISQPPEPVSTVPVSVFTAGEVRVQSPSIEGVSSGAGTTMASVSLGNVRRLEAFAQTFGGVASDAFEEIFTINVTPDTPMLVSVAVEGEIYAMGPGNVSFTAVADPRFQIDPNFPFRDFLLSN